MRYVTLLVGAGAVSLLWATDPPQHQSMKITTTPVEVDSTSPAPTVPTTVAPFASYLTPPPITPAPAAPAEQAYPIPRHVLTNEGLVVLSRAGFDEDFIIDMILLKQTRFDATVEGLAYLSRYGLSERVIRYVVTYEHKSPGLPVQVTAAPALVPVRIGKQTVLVQDTQYTGSTFVTSGWPRDRWYVIGPAASVPVSPQPNAVYPPYVVTR